MWAIVALGLGYMTPTVVFDTFGLVAEGTNNVVPLAYVFALIVMVFTAISYGKMTSQFPSAGSAYTYAKNSIHPNVGFVVGWTSMLDYMLLPLVNIIIVRSYMESFFPDIDGAVWVILFTVLATGIIYFTMRGTSNVNTILLVIAVASMIGFVAVVIGQLLGGAGEGTLITPTPFIHEGVDFSAVLLGATIVCFSFIGFDAVTMYVEEARTPRVVPRAIMLTVLIGGGIFIVTSYFTQALFPDWNVFAPGGDRQYVDDSTLPIIGELVGGQTMKVILTAAGFAATIASLLASQASVARMLLVMGRNNVLPKKLFGFVNKKTHTPTFNVIFAGVVCLTGVVLTLADIVHFINFGALVAFSFVNISVIAWFAIRQGRRHNAGDVFKFIVMPVLGLALTVILWVNLSPEALTGGLIWAAIGIVYLAILTKGFRKQVAGFDEAQPVTDFNKVVK
ncbi:MAG: APC family permease [Aurantimicrobium sp.]|uniref:APC family permease n=1 Tax=Aurantimicrobium sp. TaxID=1930784 RepID=UPI002FCA7D27